MNNNLVLYFLVFLAILFVIGIALVQKPETKKIGLFIIISIAIIALFRYYSIEHNDINSNISESGVEFLEDFNYLDSENILMILLSLLMMAFATSPFAFIIGLFLAIKGSKYRKIGLFFMIGAIIAFIIGINVCGKIHI